MQIFGFLGSLLGYVLWAAFYVFQNFGLAIVVFTLVIKLVLFPFSVKQQKSMAGNARMQKKQKELQEKYGNNRQLYQEELNKLYEKEGVKPMGGCVTMVIPMLVLFGVFYAVAYPLTNTLHLNANNVNQAVSYMSTIPGYVTSANPTYQQIALIKIFPNIVNTETIQGLFSSAEAQQIHDLAKGFDYFGFSLLNVPSDFGFWSWYLIFPVLCFLSNVGSQFIMTKVNSSTLGQPQGCMKWMLYLLPLFSAYIAFSVPCALSYYWIISALLSLVQSVILAKVFGPVQMTANSEARHAALLFENEAKVPYAYVPRETSQQNTSAPAKKKKKK